MQSNNEDRVDEEDVDDVEDDEHVNEVVLKDETAVVIYAIVPLF